MTDEYIEKLREIFPQSVRSNEQIDYAVTTILEQNSGLSEPELLEEMIGLLLESGDSTLVKNEEGAVGITLDTSNKEQQIAQNLDMIINVFPGISPEYLRNFCRSYEKFDFDQIINDLANTDYVMAEQDPIDVCEHLKQMLPDADPTYLRNQARVLSNRPPGELEEFIENAIAKKEYPTLKDYYKNKELTEEVDLYGKKFSVAAYLEKVPNPMQTFSNAERKPVLTDESEQCDMEFATTFLYNQFPFQRTKEISKIFNTYNRNLVLTCNRLKNLPKAFRHPRPAITVKECKNIELLQEIAFLKHEKVIRQYLKQKDERYRVAFEEATNLGLLQSCACCYDDQLIPEEIYFCKKGCIFCKDCVRMGAETVIGKEETIFPCLADCDSEFDYSTLQMVLDSNIFHGIWQRKQIEDIRKADIDGLETCPFCDFCMIPDKNDKIFKCQNVQCMIESCRLCRHKSHIPLRCNEIEYDEDVKMRTYIENKMTEALLRKCYNCSKQFYKDSGCNKMTCICGAKMCYLCGATAINYNHFGESRCPLYTENLREVHLTRVLEGAQAAKAELGIANDPTKLKFDPTRNIENDVQ